MRHRTFLTSAVLALASAACHDMPVESQPEWPSAELPALASMRSFDDVLAASASAGPSPALAKPSTTQASSEGAQLLDITPPGRSFAVAWKSNAAGQVVGATADADVYAQGEATLYRNGNTLNLAPPGAIQSMANELNARGQVAFVSILENGTTSISLFTPSWPNAATGSITTLVSGAASGIPGDLNEVGQVVGVFGDAEGEAHVFLWTPFPWDRRHGLRVRLPVPGRDGIATNVNEYGQVAGTFVTEEGVRHVFLWTPLVRNTIVGLLNDLGPVEDGSFLGNPMFGNGLNNAGQVILTLQSTDPEKPPITAAIWTPLRPNGFLGYVRRITDDDHVGIPFSINDAGQVSGVMTDRDGISEGFIYSPGTWWRPATVSSIGPFFPFALNNRGQLAGTSVTSEAAFVWTPETPNGARGTAVELTDFPESCVAGIIFHLDDVGQGAGTCIDSDNLYSRALFYRP